MKFALFALIAAFCVLSAHAGTVQFESNEFANTDVDVDVDGEFMDPEAHLFLTILKLALRGLKGLNCVFKWVVGIKNSALQYHNDILACGTNATQDVTNLINANMQIIETATTIMTYKTTVCGKVENPSSRALPASCFFKTSHQVIRLYAQTRRAVRLAKKIPKTGPNAVTCVADATNTLTSYYTRFPVSIKNCSLLTGN